MVYHGTVASEKIAFHPDGEPSKLHYIELTKSPHEPMFWVSCCCDENWFYSFYMEGNSDYERVKFNIMETIFECEDMADLIETLSDIFEDGFSDILIYDNDQDCENCDDNENNKYLN